MFQKWLNLTALMLLNPDLETVNGLRVLFGASFFQTT